MESLLAHQPSPPSPASHSLPPHNYDNGSIGNLEAVHDEFLYMDSDDGLSQQIPVLRRVPSRSGLHSYPAARYLNKVVDPYVSNVMWKLDDDVDRTSKSQELHDTRTTVGHGRSKGSVDSNLLKKRKKIAVIPRDIVARDVVWKR